MTLSAEKLIAFAHRSRRFKTITQCVGLVHNSE
jgi:hypothetical protein